jgi:hypothetical protein
LLSGLAAISSLYPPDLSIDPEESRPAASAKTPVNLR